ncbi:uncharacterized, partial [Tachysurus ichikawai]
MFPFARAPNTLGGGRRVTRMRRGVSAAALLLPRKHARVHAEEARLLHLNPSTIADLLLILSTVSINHTITMAQDCTGDGS